MIWHIDEKLFQGPEPVYRWADRVESYLVGKPEDRFSRFEALMFSAGIYVSRRGNDTPGSGGRYEIKLLFYQIEI